MLVHVWRSHSVISMILLSFLSNQKKVWYNDSIVNATAIIQIFLWNWFNVQILRPYIEIFTCGLKITDMCNLSFLLNRLPIPRGLVQKLRNIVFNNFSTCNPSLCNVIHLWFMLPLHKSELHRESMPLDRNYVDTTLHF